MDAEGNVITQHLSWGEREREFMCMSVSRARACMRACVRLYVYMYLCVCLVVHPCVSKDDSKELGKEELRQGFQRLVIIIDGM